MNRYISQGVVIDATNGKRVLLVSGSQAESRAALDAIAEVAASHGVPQRVRRAHGRERIDFTPGGFVIFACARTVSTVARGVLVDVAVVDGALARDQLFSGGVMPPEWAAAVSRGAEVIQP